jgi:hypothetical protein
MLSGVMAFTEAGKIHCDISAYNLLLVNPEKHYQGSGWSKPVNGGANPEIWTRTANGTHAGTEAKLANLESKEE